MTAEQTSGHQPAIRIPMLPDTEESAGKSGHVTDQLLSHMRHDLRTPINHIMGYSELLLEEAEDRGDARFVADLEKIHASGSHLLALVNDLFAAPDEGEMTLDFERVSTELRTPLNTVIGYGELLLEEARERGLDAEADDLGRIRTAGEHLFGLIDGFLGLSAAECDGKATARAPRTAVVERTHASDVAYHLEPLAHPGHVLIVDDDDTNRDVLGRRLQRLGCTIACAAGGLEALEAVRHEMFDLILLDIMMPEMNGFEVLEQLKEDQNLRHIPVIVLSAMAEVESVVACVELGAEDFLTKPFNPVLLRARISASLDKKHLRDQEVLYLHQIEQEQRRSDALLHVILPDKVVDELKTTNAVRPRRFEQVAVLFCDIVGFTTYCDSHQPEEVVAHLQRLTEIYEEIASRHGLQKIKTIGDSFMAVAGLLAPVENPVRACVCCAMEMVAVARELPPHWEVRVGIHAGPVVAGVVGRRQYLYDLWGDTVNTAARMESNGKPSGITLSAEAREAICAESHCRSLGVTHVKGKGDREIFLFEEFMGASAPSAL